MADFQTVVVSIGIFDASGNPVPGAVVVFKLNRASSVSDVIVPTYITAVAGSDGQTSVDLCPNAVCGGSYGVRIIAEGEESRGVVIVPEADCNLGDIFQAAPYPDKTFIESALEKIEADNAVVVARLGLVLVDDHDTTPDFLASKLEIGTGLSGEIQNENSGPETYRKLLVSLGEHDHTSSVQGGVIPRIYNGEDDPTPGTYPVGSIYIKHK